METGDLVIVCFGTQDVVQVAEITGDYTFNGDGEPLRHTRSVKWIKRDLRRGLLDAEVGVPMANEAVALVSRRASEAEIRALLQGRVRGGIPMPPLLQRALIWLGERLWTYGDLCVLLVLVSGIGAVVAAVVLSFNLNDWTALALGLALWLQALAAGFRLIDEFAAKWEDEHLRDVTHTRADLRPDLVGVRRALQGHRWWIVPTWLHGPLRDALRQLSLLIVGVIALVRVAQGEPILQVFERGG